MNRNVLAFGMIGLFGWTSIQAQTFDHPSAVEAMARLPVGTKEHLAAVIGYEGRPTPDRWRFIVWDPEAENGFREYVIRDGWLTASNTASQFAETVSPREQLAPGSFRVDSAKAGWLALQYAKANNLKVASLNYELRAPMGAAAPSWKVDCCNAQEQLVASILISAENGAVVARSGLPKEPNLPVIPKIKPTPPVERPPYGGEVRRTAREERRIDPWEEPIAEEPLLDEQDRDSRRSRERVPRRPRPMPLERIVRSIFPF